ncbi:hypothetical protein EVAR_97176_1 [Eumeta japonica]|uniref:Uncharacterized protein n=1 Tax=Eumeta variegata TaxID=151549 RepID=A0A4C1XUH6_EUMVA|nr:hypothetical protein EVAR_97176_1 [Eumeta japonica]
MKTKLTSVLYLGYTSMDRRFSNAMLPWLLKEIKKMGIKKKSEPSARHTGGAVLHSDERERRSVELLSLSGEHRSGDEHASRQRVGDHRRSWTSASAKELLVHCRPFIKKYDLFLKFPSSLMIDHYRFSS